MSEHIALIFKKLDHLARMREYLNYSISQAAALLPISDWQALQPDQNETLAAIRSAPELLAWHEQLHSFCQATYPKK